MGLVTLGERGKMREREREYFKVSHNINFRSNMLNFKILTIMSSKRSGYFVGVGNKYKISK